MKVVICENEEKHSEFVQAVVHSVSFHEPSIELALIASKPEEVLAYIRNERADCYLLDIELGSSINGLDLASMIRQQDPVATIIFISMHADKLKLTFKYKIAALDFIVKEKRNASLSEHLKEALQASFIKYQQLSTTDGTEFVQIKIGERIKNISYHDIYFFETSAYEHKVTLQEKNGYYEFYGKLKEFEHIDARFFRCHKSYIINLHHVKEFDKEKRQIKMKNDLVCYVSFRKITELQSKLISCKQNETFTTK